MALTNLAQLATTLSLPVSLPAAEITAGSYILAQVVELGQGETLSLQTLVFQLFSADTPGLALSEYVYAGVYFNLTLNQSPLLQAQAIASGTLFVGGQESTVSGQEPLLIITGASSVPAVAARGSQTRIFRNPGEYSIVVGNAGSVNTRVGLVGSLQYQLATS